MVKVQRHILVTKENREKLNWEDQMTALNNLRQITELVAEIGHEVRTPLATVRGLLQILLAKTTSVKERDYYSLMIGELDRANNLLNEFLTLARTRPFQAQWDNLNQILTDIYPLILANATNCGKQLAMELTDIPDLYLDRNEIIQLILNIVRNGLEVTPKGGKVTVRTLMEENQVVLSVRDEGCGIPDEVMKKLGTPFYSTKEEGVGLGLAVCKKIADNHQAMIAIETGETGSVFLISFAGAGSDRKENSGNSNDCAVSIS